MEIQKYGMNARQAAKKILDGDYSELQKNAANLFLGKREIIQTADPEDISEEEREIEINYLEENFLNWFGVQPTNKPI